MTHFIYKDWQERHGYPYEQSAYDVQQALNRCTDGDKLLVLLFDKGIIDGDDFLDLVDGRHMFYSVSS